MTVSPGKQFYYCFSCGAGATPSSPDGTTSASASARWCWLARKYQLAGRNRWMGPAGAPAPPALPIAGPACVPSPWPAGCFAAQPAQPPPGAPALRHLRPARPQRKHPSRASRSANAPIGWAGCSAISPGGRPLARAASKPPAGGPARKGGERRPNVTARHRGYGARSTTPGAGESIFGGAARWR